MLDGCTARCQSEMTEYRQSGYWKGELLGSSLRRWAREQGKRTALVGSRTRLSYAALDAWADRLAAGFQAAGIRPRERVVVQLPNIPEFVAICFGLFRCGAIPVFSLPAHRNREIRHLAEIAEASAIIVPAVLRGFDHRAMAAEVCDAVPSVRQVVVVGEPGPGQRALAELDLPGTEAGAPDHPGDPADVAFFLLSGGTTALPKLIPRTHEDYGYQLRAAAELCRLGPDAVYLAVLPVAFNFTWGCPGVLGTMEAGGTAVLAGDPSPETCFALIAQERVTLSSVVPTVAHVWLEALRDLEPPPDLSSLRVLQIGSAKLHREVAERIGPAFGCRLQQVFGMAEGLLTMTRHDDPEESVLTTQGRPLSPADRLTVADPVTGRPVPDGAVGELLTRGPYTLLGYYKAPEHNARAFTADGWFRTGDLVRLTGRGELVHEGRVKDVVVRGGDKISAAEIEGELVQHPAVRQVAVVAVPDPLLGECTCACVVPGGRPPRLVELKRMLLERGLAEYKLPDRLEVYDTFPLTGLGKVDKKLLVADVQARDAARVPG